MDRRKLEAAKEIQNELVGLERLKIALGYPVIGIGKIGIFGTTYEYDYSYIPRGKDAEVIRGLLKEFYENKRKELEEKLDQL